MKIELIFFLRNNYNMLLTSQLEPFPPQTPKNFVHGEVPIQIQGFWQQGRGSDVLEISHHLKYPLFLHHPFIFNQFSISILCGVMFIIMVFNTQILVSWLFMDVHIGKISNSTLLCQYFIHTHTHIYYKLKATQIYLKKKKLKEKFTTTHIKIYTQRNSEFNNYKQYKFLNITKKIQNYS